MAKLHLNYYLVADAAYTALEWCLVPFKGNFILNVSDLSF